MASGAVCSDKEKKKEAVPLIPEVSIEDERGKYLDQTSHANYSKELNSKYLLDAPLPTLKFDKCVPQSCYNLPTGHQRQCGCQRCIAIRKMAIKDENFLCSEHVDGKVWKNLEKKSFNPEANAIKKKLKCSTAGKEMRWEYDDENLSYVDLRFRLAKQGELGKSVIHHGAALDYCNPPKRDMVHGIAKKDPDENIKNLLNPPMKTWYEKLENDLEESIYKSNKWGPIGRSHCQSMNLPSNIHPELTSFGVNKKTSEKISGGQIINPLKSKEMVEEESQCCQNLYKISHEDFNPGEQRTRNYEGQFDKSAIFGIKKPSDITGKHTKEIVSNWLTCNGNNAESDLDTKNCNNINLENYQKSIEEMHFIKRQKELGKNPILHDTRGEFCWSTTYSDATNNLLCNEHLRQLANNEIPKIRVRISKKTIGDKINNREDGDAFSLLWPSVYTIRGIGSEDVFKSLTKEQMNGILRKACIELSLEKFDSVWEKAKGMDPENVVSFHSFKQALYCN